MADTLMTKPEACRFLRISSRTLDRWRSMWKARKEDPLGEVKIRKRPGFQRAAVGRLFRTPKPWRTEARSRTNRNPKGGPSR